MSDFDYRLPDQVQDLMRAAVRDVLTIEGLTQPEAADKAGLSFGHFTRWLAGRSSMTPIMVERILASLGYHLAFEATLEKLPS